MALAHDVIITVGVYALSGFEVSPATVTGLLTILGFSLYDTVVVFDKIRENTKNLRATRTTYAKAANLAVNQTLVRSINTSLVALIPVGAILYVSAVQLGASSLKDLALALFVGMAAGAYSSIFIATPLLVHLKSTRDRGRARRAPGQGARAAQRRPLRVGAGRSRTTCRSWTPTEPGGVLVETTTSTTRTTTRPTRPRAASGLDARGDGPRPDGADHPASGRPEPGVRAAAADPAAALEAQVTAMTGRVTGRRAGGAGAPGRRRPRLPRAGGGLQGHHAAARRPRRLHRGHRRRWPRPAATSPAATVVDKVVGMEARGFILAAPVALALGTGFVPVRKAGKLPRETHAVSYALEYGEATLELHRDAIAAGGAGAARRRRAGHRRHRRRDPPAGRVVRRRRRRGRRADGAELPARPGDHRRPAAAHPAHDLTADCVDAA